mgnify:CR=1 FL=1
MALESKRITKKEFQTYYEPLRSDFERMVNSVNSSMGFGQIIQKYIGTEENWQRAEQAIIEATEEMGLDTFIAHGEAAFYGPKLDFMVQDALGRAWQLGTIQVDYNLPERFELEYIGADNKNTDR